MTELPHEDGQTSPSSLEDVSSAIRALSPAQLRRLHDYAKWRARAMSVAGCVSDDEDLLQEAITRTLSGERRWNKDLAFDIHLIGVIRSISSHARMRLIGIGLVRGPATSGCTVTDERKASPSDPSNPERTTAAKQFIDQLNGRFRDDPDVQLVMEGLSDGLTPEDYNRRGLSGERREAAVKRLRRYLHSKFPNGQTDVI